MEEVEVTNTLLDSRDMVGEVESILENPQSLPDDLQYDSKEDPEYTANAAEMREAFWAAYMTNGVDKMEEGFSIKNAIKDYVTKNGGKIDVDGFIDSLPSDVPTAKYYKTHRDVAEQQLNAYLAKNPAVGAAAAEAEPAKPFSADDLTNDLAKELVTSGGDGVDEVMSAKDSAEDKFSTIYSIAKTIFQGKGIKHHAFIYGDPGVGKTYSVKKAMQVEFPRGALSKKGYSIEWNSGDIGKAASNMVSFFYKHRQNKVIVLDDCDSFVLSKDQAIQNLLKGMLDLDNTEKNPKYITTPASIRNLASKILANEAKSEMHEGVEFSIDQEKLLEGRLVMSIEGEEVLNEAIEPEELKKFKIVETKKPVRESKKALDTGDYFGLGLMNEAVVNDDDDNWDGELSEEDQELAEQLNQLDNDYEDDVEIPPKWRFTSRLIMISNLRKSDLNDAVLSRTLSYELSLTQEEFLARLSEILPNLLTDVETESSMEIVEYAKKVAFANLIAAVDIANHGGAVKGKRVIIDQKLQFRIIAELAGKWMQRADDYAEKNGITTQDRLTLDRINNDIKMNFFVFDVIPSLKA